MHVKSANFARSFAALLLLQTLLPQGADTKPVAGVKSLLGGMAMGTLGGMVLHHAVAKHMQHQTQQQQPIASQQPQLLSLPPQSPNVAEHQPNQYGQPQYPLLQAPHPAEQNSAQLGHPQFSQSAIQQPPQSGYPHLLQPVVQQPPQPGHVQVSQPAEQHLSESVQQQPQEVQSQPTGGILDSLLQIKRPVDQPNAPQQQHQNAPQNPNMQTAPAAPAEQSAQPHPVITPNQAPPAQDINKQPAQPTALHPAVVQPATVGGIPIQPVQHVQPPQPIYPVHPAQATSQVIVPSKKPGYFGKSSADKIPQINFFLMAMMAFLVIWCK
ncbi:mediator of RNA polymerase II transcription subunit 15-like [Anastrepha obliqua]|uniref:mediator of RNA polymerase II transcription subunit 15-like n=1 Tax=Anastrepha obliqua TaxID=95512 RepID=UPI002409167D|nr:mediator of RNA polymerase II transcription subunit 15-like [Anastrepha obliqua]